MGLRIIEFIRKYHLVTFSIITTVFLLINERAVHWWYMSHPHETGFLHPTEEAMKLLVLVCGLALIVATFITSIMNRVYKDRTGRNMILDMQMYNRTYWELLRFFRDADPYRMNEKKLPVGNWKEAEGVILGKKGYRIIKRSAFESGGDGANYLLFALPGAGKTTAQIIPSALRWGGSVLAIDIKSDIYKATRDYRRIRCFSPDDPKSSCTFDPLFGYQSMNDSSKRNLIETIAEILVKDDKNGKYFVEGGRDCFCGVALYLLETESGTTFPDILKAIIEKDAVTWITTIAKSDCTLAKMYTDGYYQTNEKNVSGAYGEMRKYVRRVYTDELLSLLVPSDKCIEPRTLEAGYDVYLEIPQDKIRFYAPICTIIVQRFMVAFMQRPDKASGEETRPVLFLLDEFPQLTFDEKLETLSAALATLRSKRCSIFMAAQGISQISKRYGEDGLREIMDTCSYVSIMSVQDPASREFFQRLLGTRKVLKMSSNSGSDMNAISSSRGLQEDREPIFREGDFSNLGDDVIIYAKGKYIKAEKTYYYK